MNNKNKHLYEYDCVVWLRYIYRIQIIFSNCVEFTFGTENRNVIQSKPLSHITNKWCVGKTVKTTNVFSFHIRMRILSRVSFIEKLTLFDRMLQIYWIRLIQNGIYLWQYTHSIKLLRLFGPQQMIRQKRKVESLGSCYYINTVDDEIKKLNTNYVHEKIKIDFVGKIANIHLLLNGTEKCFFWQVRDRKDLSFSIKMEHGNMVKTVCTYSRGYSLQSFALTSIPKTFWNWLVRRSEDISMVGCQFVKNGYVVVVNF